MEGAGRHGSPAAQALIGRRALLAAGAALAAAGPARAAPPPGTLRLRHGDGRETDYRVYLPARPGRLGLLVFSHGAKANNRAYDAMLQPWADAGFVVAAPNHLDADLAGPTPPGLAPSRADDLRLALDNRETLARLAADAGSNLDGPASAAGHSFGGGIAQIVAGANIMDVPGRADPRISCVVAFSPPGSKVDAPGTSGWSDVRVPAFLETGTADIVVPYFTDWRQHKHGFEADKGRHRWLVVGENVDHFFGGAICFLADGPKAAEQAPALKASVSLAADFLLAYAKQDKAALARLEKAAARKTYAPTLTLTAV